MDIQKQTVLDAARAANELNRFRGAMIARAYIQDSPAALYLELHKPEAIIKCVIEAKYAYIGYLEKLPDQILKPVNLLSGYSVKYAAQFEGDRIVAIELEREDRLGRLRTARLILELIPNIGNCILVNDAAAVRWALRRRNADAYSPPPPLEKPTILNLSDSNISTLIQRPGSLAQNIMGLNQRDLLNIRPELIESPDEIIRRLKQYAVKASAAGEAWIVYRENEPVGFSLVAPALESGETFSVFASALAMYEHYYNRVIEESSQKDRHQILFSLLDREIERRQKRIAILQNETLSAKNSGIFGIFGKLILSNIDAIRKGAKTVRLKNFDDAEYLEIELDPSKSAAENAEKYFKKYKKAQSSLKTVSRRLESAQQEIASLKQIKSQAADNPKLLEEKLLKINLISGKAAKKSKPVQQKRLPYKKYMASNGWDILVGRTNTDNDELTFKIARKDDYWFHAWQAAGSHVVLRLPNKEAIPDKMILLEAASLAAHFSKARTSTKVPIACTQVKYVRKPKNFAPGKVLVEKEKQLMVRPANPDDFLIKNDSEE